MPLDDDFCRIPLGANSPTGWIAQQMKADMYAGLSDTCI